jgi:ubiquinone biosynthesis protein UbiJ
LTGGFSPMLFAPLEAALNRNIAASAAARALCERLEGKTLAVKVAGLPFDLYLRCSAGRLHVTSTQSQSDATLSGTVVGLMSLAGAGPESAVRGGSVHIEGDAEVAQGFKELLALARPEFEEELARFVGDVPAHQIGRLARGALDFGKRLAGTFTQNVAEYLQEESRDLPSATEVAEFLQDVDRLRDDTERLEARLKLLENK